MQRSCVSSYNKDKSNESGYCSSTPMDYRDLAVIESPCGAGGSIKLKLREQRNKQQGNNSNTFN